MRTLKDIKDVLVKIPDDVLEGLHFGTGEGSEETVGLVALETGSISKDQIGFPEVFDKYPQLDKINHLIRNIIKTQEELDKQEESEVLDNVMEEGISTETFESEVKKLNNTKSGESEMKDKFILDACCGARAIWIQKNHPNCLYIDIRKKEKGFLAFRPNREINPNEIVDFRNLPYKDKSFKLIVWDPPHLKGKQREDETDAISATYGKLDPITWQIDLKKGFNEIWRCLEDYGVLIFKFNNYAIPFNKVLNLFPEKALFGTTSNHRKNSITKWFTYMKIPSIAQSKNKSNIGRAALAA